MTYQATVAAPCAMPEGYTFNAVVDGRDIPVTVPAGGVKQGQEISFVVATGLAQAIPSVISEQHNTPGGGLNNNPVCTTAAVAGGRTYHPPQGAWRHGLCSWGQVCCSGLWWFGCCCPSIVMGQMLSRMNLNFCGDPALSAQQAQDAFTIVVVLFLVSILGNCILPGCVWVAFFIYAMIFGTKLRSYMRSKYNIAGSGCGDCCCVFWCGCCTSIQMIRHTQPDDVRYNCCAHHGMGFGAPTIV